MLVGLLIYASVCIMADPAAIIANQVNQTNTETDDQYSDYPEFPIPADFTPPQGTKTGEPFQALGTFRIKSDGSMCLLAVDGSPVSSSEGEAEATPPTAPPVSPAASPPTAQ